MQGLSVHIGLNEVDPNHYRDGAGKPWRGQLAACENDARSMAELAGRQGFQAGSPLLTQQATSGEVTSRIRAAAQVLEPGDYFLLTYSGHGGQVVNKNPDDDPEDDALDETWCLFDRELLDDELFALFSEFKPGVRIVVLSDSCHSGTVSRGDPPAVASLPEAKQLPFDVAEATERTNANLYQSLQQQVPSKRLTSLAATVVLLSGCKDSEFSRDGRVNGAFTEALLKAWDDPLARKSMEALQKGVIARIPPEYNQNPSLSIYSFNIAPPITI